MSEQFNNKDYRDYFSAIEKSLEKETQSNINIPKAEKQDTPASRGAVIMLRPWVYFAVVFLIVILIVVLALTKKGKEQPESPQETEIVDDVVEDAEKEPEQKINLYAEFSKDTAQIATDIDSGSVIVINCDTNKVVAARNATEKCYPASTTKIMTILTAVDYITDYTKTFTFNYEITDPFYRQEATMAGFANGEAVSMTDMLYGAILPSGADATVGIAMSIAGSEEEFVRLMNKKAEELGLKNTHFTNASGLFDKNHYTTAEDMAVIVRAASENELCKKILSTYQYTTAATPQHPEGISLTSTLFSYMYGTEPEGSDIIGGKTGFVNESGYCIASFGKSDNGTEYVCVTLKGLSLWPTVYDQIDLYTRYAK